MRLFISTFVLIAVLASCGASTVRYAAAPVSSGGRIAIGLSRLEVREVSLPAYARSEEIWREAENGALTSDAATLWADDPARGVTMELSHHLATMSGARVAAEPWPFEDLPQARLVVRVKEMVAGADGRFRISGQYFVAHLDGGRDRSGEFNLSAPFTPDGGAPAIAAARATVVRDLARVIADRGF
ncbi:ABC-type transport auxiliary lipoprotein family protein [Tropicimonas sp. TH_r6]|uniref:PqiC family protein n=1 Tax=Tropicimonas sp. TH_r6 TaxID=3082085 RepID=UPI002954E6E9|nr:ABC-type transport auxiliary lipoprotein family protein [Tropicimonas sp. TH_r6]MDV7142288.1 ABC-type transport auxiliary lipoprotein family protein [Tropicimonas sp. TH_r6]